MFVLLLLVVLSGIGYLRSLDIVGSGNGHVFGVILVDIFATFDVVGNIIIGLFLFVEELLFGFELILTHDQIVEVPLNLFLFKLEIELSLL